MLKKKEVFQKIFFSELMHLNRHLKETFKDIPFFANTKFLDFHFVIILMEKIN